MHDDARTSARPSHTMTVLRVAMVLAWAGITVSNLSSPRVAGSRAVLVIAAVGALTVLVAMLANLHRAPPARTTRRALVLLAVQVVAGIVVATDYMFLVAIELPLVLRPRDASIAFALLVAMVMAVGTAMALWGTFFAAPELAGMAWGWQVFFTMLMTAGWLALAFAGGLLAATEARARQEVNRLMAELRLTNRVLADTTRESERLRIARELHDTVGHRLAALGVQLDLESRRAAGESAGSLREARDATQQLLGEVRQVVSAIRQEGAVDLKRALAEMIGGLSTPEVELVVSPGFELHDSAASHALLRCAQEALTNVVRHAHAAHARVELRRDDRGVTLIVRDDGAGAAALCEGHGLRGMRERLAPLGGTLSVETRPGVGVQVTAWVPTGEAAR